MDMNQAFPSKYIKADDLQGKEWPLVIRNVVREDVGTDQKPDNKPVIYFNGTEKGMVLNVTNNNAICDMFGFDSDMWLGKTITLIAIQTEFQGKPCLGLRVKLPGATNLAAPIAAAPLAGDVPPVPAAAPIGAESPFGGATPTTEQAQDITNSEGGGAVLEEDIPF